MEKVVPARNVTCLPELTSASQLFIHFLTKPGEPCTRETKHWLGQKGDVMLGSSFQPANFSPYKHFASPGRVNSVKATQGEHARALFQTIRACAIACLDNQSMFWTIRAYASLIQTIRAFATAFLDNPSADLDNQSVRERCFRLLEHSRALFARAQGSYSSSYKRLSRLGGGPIYPGQVFSIFTGPKNVISGH